MTSSSPTVSVGLPVFNGENYLEEAVDSILSQTYSDLELVISDNASTDRTREICEGYARSDPRVRYLRNPENLGAAANYTRVFEAATGRFFKWCAHDDVYEPEFLARCVDVLENDPGIVLCHTRTVIVDTEGNPIKEWGFGDRFQIESPHRRFAEALGLGKMCLIWGVMRRSTLARTGLLGNYAGHDRPLISALSLLGRFHEVQETLFRNREHPERSIRAYNWRRPQEAIVWYDPTKAGRITFPHWRMLKEHLAGLFRAKLPPGEALRCLPILWNWTRGSRKSLRRDLKIARAWLLRTPRIVTRGGLGDS
jgi:glycosyltransferase involved in cell wall biosynthesis